jgi:hypothetical protein
MDIRGSKTVDLHIEDEGIIIVGAKPCDEVGILIEGILQVTNIMVSDGPFVEMDILKEVQQDLVFCNGLMPGEGILFLEILERRNDVILCKHLSMVFDGDAGEFEVCEELGPAQPQGLPIGRFGQASVE